MRKFYLFILILVIFLIILSSKSFGEIEVKSILGISGEWKINKWCPLFIHFKNLGEKRNLDLEVIFTQGLRFAGNSKTIYKQSIEIPPLSTRTIELLLPPLDFRYPIEIKATSKDGDLKYNEKIEFNIEKVILPLVLILGEERNIPLSFPPKTRIINIINEKQLPTNYKAYDSADYIFIQYDFWKTLSPSKKNALRLFRAFEGRAFFIEEIKNFSSQINLEPSKVQFFPPSFLESPDLSIIDMQSFSYPNRFQILIFLSIYLISLYLLRKLIKKFKYLILSMSILLLLTIIISFLIGSIFRQDSLIIGEKGIIYLTPDKEIAELYSHLVFFSPYKRELIFQIQPNMIQLYQPFYQPQRNIGPLRIEEQKAFLSMEKNKISYIEVLSILIFPIKVFYEHKNKDIKIKLENNSNYNIKDLVFTFENKDFYLGDLEKGKAKTWNILLEGSERESLFPSIISKWKIKNDIIKKKKIFLWGKIEESLVKLDIDKVKYNLRTENIFIFPLS
ncbi:MAG: hypothetical protein NZ841_03800 [Dictyoglomus sp.]|nr:hypothetical protein [Dictyoglomus sp.]MCX7942790.1 hypothetical protein [Dictyoglomaceae bacterium]MDW8188402.1 hypothetical protein [Dictyoglomus sp.]